MLLGSAWWVPALPRASRCAWPHLSSKEGEARAVSPPPPPSSYPRYISASAHAYCACRTSSSPPPPWERKPRPLRWFPRGTIPLPSTSFILIILSAMLIPRAARGITVRRRRVPHATVRRLKYSEVAPDAYEAPLETLKNPEGHDSTSPRFPWNLQIRGYVCPSSPSWMGGCLGQAVAWTYLSYTRLDKNPVTGCHHIHSRPPVYREPPTHPDPFIGRHMHTAPPHAYPPALAKAPHRSTRVSHQGRSPTWHATRSYSP